MINTAFYFLYIILDTPYSIYPALRSAPAPNSGASPRCGKNLAQCDWREQSKFVATNYVCSCHTEGERFLTSAKKPATIPIHPVRWASDRLSLWSETG